MASTAEPFDQGVPSTARRYNALLQGGKDHLAADRDAAGELRRNAPDVELAANELRRFMGRAVDYLARDCGIRQFVDIGCGMPLTPNVHDIAQAVTPQARIAYVDPDPVVAVHARALLTGTDQGSTVFVSGALPDVDAILKDEQLREVIDFNQPVAVLLLAVLHFVVDDQQAQQAVEQITARLPAGSYLAISHVTFDPLPQELADRLTLLSGDPVQGPFRARSREQISGFFTGYDLADPGLVSTVQWHPDRPPVPDAAATAVRAMAYGGVGRLR